MMGLEIGWRGGEETRAPTIRIDCFHVTIFTFYSA